MSWIKSAMGGDKPDKDKFDLPDHAIPIYDGPLENAGSDLADGIAKIMNYSINAIRPHGQRPFKEVGEEMHYRMNGVILGTKDNPDAEISGGDFEIIVRRIG